MNPTILLVLATMLAASAERGWFGHWVLNSDASHLTGDSVEITAAKTGGGFDVQPFATDVQPPQSAASGAVTLQQAADGSWVLQSKVQGHLVMHGRVTLTPDQKQLTIATVADDAPAATGAASEVYDRVGTGSGPAGVWKSRQGEFGSGNFDLQSASGGRIKWSMPDDQQFYVLKPGGPAAPYQGAHGDPSLTVALRSVTAREMRWTEFVSGHAYVEATDSLSSDGARLTEVSWQTGTPGVRQTAIYERR
jgi:hypothetical protein